MPMRFELAPAQEEGAVTLKGAVQLSNIVKIRRQLKEAHGKVNKLDVSGVTHLDTAGAMLLQQLARKHIVVEGLREPFLTLFTILGEDRPKRKKEKPHHSALKGLLIRLGKGTTDAFKTLGELTIFLGQATVALGRAFRHPRHLRFGEIVHHIEHIGINAVPIISLIAFLISVVLAYQSNEQLRPLGAQQFTINLITISVLREMGVLLTAIMVAGRSGSAFTAEIGVMKIREEVDALKAIGIDPFELLVVPRLIAIVIALPLLAFISDIMGLLGGAVLTKALVGISFDQYINQVHTLASNGHALFVGLIKAPVFAFFIGLVAAMHGMKVNGSAESVGIETTTSVVQSIFLVLILDALFSIFFQQVGL